MWLYLDELQFKFEFRSSRMIFGCAMALELVFFVQIYTSSRALTQPKIIRPERNWNINCNSSRYSHIPNIKSISQRTSKKGPDNLKFEQDIQVQGPDFFLRPFIY
jgi:hypothetical protein